MRDTRTYFLLLALYCFAGWMLLSVFALADDHDTPSLGQAEVMSGWMESDGREIGRQAEEIEERGRRIGQAIAEARERIAELEDEVERLEDELEDTDDTDTARLINDLREEIAFLEEQLKERPDECPPIDDGSDECEPTDVAFEYSTPRTEFREVDGEVYSPSRNVASLVMNGENDAVRLDGDSSLFVVGRYGYAAIIHGNGYGLTLFATEEIFVDNGRFTLVQGQFIFDPI